MEFDELSEYASFRSFPGYHRRVRGTRLQRIPATPRLPIDCTAGTSLSSFDPYADSSNSETPSNGYSFQTTATSSSTRTPDSASDISAVDNNSLICWHNSPVHGIGIPFRRNFQSRRQGTPNFGGLPSLVSRCDHVGVIELPGASVSGVRILLVHEFVNGDPKLSVVDLLRRSMMMMTTDPNFTALSTWISRLNIAADVARGLDHIHNTKGLRSTLLDSEIVKSSSILVSVGCELRDELGDRPNQFGISPIDAIRSSLMNQGEEMETAAEGNEKSDVYAYGGLILELISGEEPRTAVIEVARAVVDGRVLKWMWKDRRMEDSFPEKLVEKLLRIAVNCLDEDPGKRPEIGNVAGNTYRLCLESREWSDGGGDLWQGLHHHNKISKL